MAYLWIISAVLVLLYLIWIGMFWYGWEKTPDASGSKPGFKIPVSVVVPARNEEANLLPMLEALTSQDYPQNLIEIIITDDHSTDLTPEITRYYANRHGNIRYVRLDNAEEGKKKALLKGILATRYPLILTTDADCLPATGWISAMVDCFKCTNADLVAGPVLLKGNCSFFSKFQKLEFLSLLGSTAGSLAVGRTVMCNSANLGFRKEAYLEVSSDIYPEISSGDDVFLLMALQRTGDKKLVYLKSRDAVVKTPVADNAGDFLKQRQRWTSKSGRYRDPPSVFTALLVFLINFCAVACMFLAPFYPESLLITGLILIGKSVVDFPFLFSVSSFFGQARLMIFFLPVQFLYIFYISFTVLTAFIEVFDWKGRIVKL